MVGWHEDFHDPHNWVHPFLASGGTFSRTQGWSKDLYAQLDSRISRAVSSTAKNTRSQAYAQLQDLAYQNALSIYLTRPLGRHYQQMWIKGLYYNPAYSNGFSYYALSKGQ